MREKTERRPIGTLLAPDRGGVLTTSAKDFFPYPWEEALLQDLSSSAKNSSNSHRQLGPPLPPQVERELVKIALKGRKLIDEKADLF